MVSAVSGESALRRRQRPAERLCTQAGAFLPAFHGVHRFLCWFSVPPRYGIFPFISTCSPGLVQAALRGTHVLPSAKYGAARARQCFRAVAIHARRMLESSPIFMRHNLAVVHLRLTILYVPTSRWQPRLRRHSRSGTIAAVFHAPFVDVVLAHDVKRIRLIGFSGESIPCPLNPASPRISICSPAGEQLARHVLLCAHYGRGTGAPGRLMPSASANEVARLVLTDGLIVCTCAVGGTVVFLIPT